MGNEPKQEPKGGLNPIRAIAGITELQKFIEGSTNQELSTIVSPFIDSMSILTGQLIIHCPEARNHMSELAKLTKSCYIAGYIQGMKAGRKEE